MQHADMPLVFYALINSALAQTAAPRSPTFASVTSEFLQTFPNLRRLYSNSVSDTWPSNPVDYSLRNFPALLANQNSARVASD